MQKNGTTYYADSRTSRIKSRGNNFDIMDCGIVNSPIIKYLRSPKN